MWILSTQTFRVYDWILSTQTPGGLFFTPIGHHFASFDVCNNYKIYYQYPPNPRTHRTQEPTEPKNHRTQEPPNSEIICSRFCYSSVGIWPLSNILRSRSVIAQWVYEQFSNILRNHLKRHRPTAMIELSQRKQGEIGLENDGRGVPTYASDVFLRLSKIKCLEIEKP